MKNDTEDRIFYWKMQFALALFISSCAIFFVSCSGCSRYMKTWQEEYPDNPVEEVLEEAIDQKTGIDLDLTPATPER